MMAPPIVVPWSLTKVVREWMTMSAPGSIGQQDRCRHGAVRDQGHAMAIRHVRQADVSDFTVGITVISK